MSAAEEAELAEKESLLLLAPFVGDHTTTHSWLVGQPLKTWRRVATDEEGARVVGINLVSTRAAGDLEALVPVLARFAHLRTLLLQNNPGVHGDIRHLSVLMGLEELRLPGESITGNLNGLSGLVGLKKFQIYNKKHVEGLASDMKKQLPNCSINLDIKNAFH